MDSGQMADVIARELHAVTGARRAREESFEKKRVGGRADSGSWRGFIDALDLQDIDMIAARHREQGFQRGRDVTREQLYAQFEEERLRIGRAALEASARAFGTAVRGARRAAGERPTRAGLIVLLESLVEAAEQMAENARNGALDDTARSL